jgi:hypothetical protein
MGEARKISLDVVRKLCGEGGDCYVEVHGSTGRRLSALIEGALLSATAEIKAKCVGILEARMSDSGRDAASKALSDIRELP